MPNIKKPDTVKGQTEQLWLGVYGNGAPGLIDHVHGLVAEQAEIKGTVQYIRGQIDTVCGQRKMKPRKVILKRIGESAASVAVVVLVLAGVVLLLTRALTPDDIANILRAWKGG